jgi:nitrate reductase (cytochrome), electron transfer subunit
MKPRSTPLLGAALALLALVAGCAAVGVQDIQVGLRKAGVFEVLTPVPFQFDEDVKTRPVAPLPGSGMPPMITHAVEDSLPITARANGCLECHDKPQNIGKPVAAGKAKPAPASHYTGTGSALALDGRQYNCMNCHAPQAEVPPLVVNSSR